MPSHKVYLWKAGSIPGFGMFPGNTVVEIDDETNALISQSPILPGLPQDADAPPDAQSVPGQAPAPPDNPALPSASAASVASSEADAAVLADSSSPEPAATPLKVAPLIDLPVNGG